MRPCPDFKPGVATFLRGAFRPLRTSWEVVGTAAQCSGIWWAAVNPWPDRSKLPILAVDVDGVVSLFGFEGAPPASLGRVHLVDGIPHFISAGAGERLRRLIDHYELVWATGWEERANDYLPTILGLPMLPFLRFGGDARFGSAHWKLGPIEEFAQGRPLAWIDDSLTDECYEWARQRPDPTLLVPTEPVRGIEEAHVEALLRWAEDGYRL